jgi:hypothetical protein
LAGGRLHEELIEREWRYRIWRNELDRRPLVEVDPITGRFRRWIAAGAVDQFKQILFGVGRISVAIESRHREPSYGIDQMKLKVTETPSIH